METCAANLELWFTVDFSEGKVNNNSPTGNYSQLHWFEMPERRKEVGAVFVDFRKVFDLVPHHALLEKLENL